MTQTTEQERAEFEDGAWCWVEKEGWIGEPPIIAPALYKRECDAWYSVKFSGIPTRHLKVLEPCEQAARRAQVVPIGWRLVPDANNMTDEQAEAICNLVGCCGGGAHEVYEAALAAAPQPPACNPSMQPSQEQQDKAKHEALVLRVLREALERIADKRNTHFSGDAQVVAREALAAAPQPPEADMGIPITQSNLVESRRIKEPAPSADHIPDVGKMVAKETPFTAVNAAVNKNLEVYRRVISKRAAPKTPPAA